MKGYGRLEAAIGATESPVIVEMFCTCGGRMGTLHQDGTLIAARKASWRNAYAAPDRPMTDAERDAWKRVYTLPKHHWTPLPAADEPQADLLCTKCYGAARVDLRRLRRHPRRTASFAPTL